ncbi:hypothetical protein JCM19274_1484 [Algibacter lectus]|uniref:Uncharacterized protein n=1 Tax=Algibacter lectus TaxID=221126 RepID=A0A090WX49_9FLAO|nr:hypothetical protein JCM19274_1484 [Algibacter lectus]
MKVGDLQYYRRNWAPFNILHEVENNYVDLDLTDLSLQTSSIGKLMKILLLIPFYKVDGMEVEQYKLCMKTLIMQQHIERMIHY